MLCHFIFATITHLKRNLQLFVIPPVLWEVTFKLGHFEMRLKSCSIKKRLNVFFIIAFWKSKQLKNKLLFHIVLISEKNPAFFHRELDPGSSVPLCQFGLPLEVFRICHHEGQSRAQCRKIAYEMKLLSQKKKISPQHLNVYRSSTFWL